MGFPRQEDWSGLPFPTLEDLPEPDGTCFFCIGRRILYHWATRKTLWYYIAVIKTQINIVSYLEQIFLVIVQLVGE